MKRILNIAAAVLLAAAVLVSCEPGPAGLFAMLEQETPKNKGTPALNANTAKFVVRAHGYYYAAVGKTLLRRPVTGGTWMDVSDPNAMDTEITAGVTDDTNTDLFLSYGPSVSSPQKRIRKTTDGTNWIDFALGTLPVGEPVHNLLFANNVLFAVTQPPSLPDPKTTYYSLYFDDGDDGTFTATQVIGEASVFPESIAFDGSTYWLSARNTVLKGSSGSEGAIDIDPAVTSDISVSNPVSDVIYDGTRAIAAGTGYLFDLSNSYAKSAVFGSENRSLSTISRVPMNGGGFAVIVGAQSWRDTFTGYYEYDPSLFGTFSDITPSTTYNLVSFDNTDYVTTLDDLSIDGFYYDSTDQVLFARTVGGGLWSKKYSGTTWSKWDRE